jgi:PPOX class probable FMN-dependent enzyme
VAAAWHAARVNYQDLRGRYADPAPRTLAKERRRLDEHCRHFISLSPFAVLATATSDGSPDLSPRGGDPGFVRTPDDTTLLLADRPGNNRLDNLGKVTGNAEVAVLFLVPGIDETLRVYGTGEVIAEEEVPELPPGIASRTVLRVAVTRTYFHCGKALMRSDLWAPESRVDRSVFPTLGQVLKDQLGDPGLAESQEDMLRRYQAGL